MKVLVGCEFSGTVRDAFARLGHDAWSCDLLPTETPGNHLQQDLLEVIGWDWDLVIAHPPCTYLTCAQNKWYLPEYRHRFPDRKQKQKQAIDFFLALADRCKSPKMAIENPVGVMSTHYRCPDQIIQPYQFGHDARKTTCLWLRGLPELVPTDIVPVTIHTTKSGNTMSAWHMKCGHSSNQVARAKLRSVTFQGIAEAMASQWGDIEGFTKSNWPSEFLYSADCLIAV